MPTLLVTFECDPASRLVIEATIGSKANVVYLSNLRIDQRAEAFTQATVVLARNTANELSDGEAKLIRQASLLQFVTAGVDYIPLRNLPASLPISCNGGAYAEPMAEHAVMMALAAMKWLLVEHGGRLDGDDPEEIAQAEALLAMLARMAGSKGAKEKRHLDELLDGGLKQTFPASDPVSVGHFTGTEPPSQPTDRAVVDLTRSERTKSGKARTRRNGLLLA